MWKLYSSAQCRISILRHEMVSKLYILFALCLLSMGDGSLRWFKSRRNAFFTFFISCCWEAYNFLNLTKSPPQSANDMAAYLTATMAQSIWSTRTISFSHLKMCSSKSTSFTWVIRRSFSFLTLTSTRTWPWATRLQTLVNSRRPQYDACHEYSIAPLL